MSFIQEKIAQDKLRKTLESFLEAFKTQEGINKNIDERLCLLEKKIQDIYNLINNQDVKNSN